MHKQHWRVRLINPCVLLSAFLVPISIAAGADLRVGIIGCDTSHVIAFTEILNDDKAKDHVPGARVVAAFKGGSPDVHSSASRVESYAKTLQDKHGVKIYDSIEEMCGNIDAVLLESVDGRPHLEQVKPVLKAGKPVFIDKPIAASLRDAKEIFRLAKNDKVPVFSASALRFGKETQSARAGVMGKIYDAETYGPCELEPHHPDLFWYGVHGVEALYTILGTGCETVQRGTTPEGKIEVIGAWSGERKGIYREDKGFHGTVRGEKGQMAVGSFDGYAPLVAEIVKFFQTGIAPVKPEETLEIIAFMEAADLSKKRGGAAVKLKELLR